MTGVQTCALPISYIFPVLLLLFAYIISSIFSIDTQNSIKETAKFISFVSVFFIVSQASNRQKNALIKTIVIAASIISLYSIYQYLWGYQCTLDYIQKMHSDFLATSSYAQDILIGKRAIGTFPSPNILGGYLIVVFFLALHLGQGEASTNKWPRLRPGKFWYAAPFLIITALLLTKSMGAWLSLIFTLTVLFIILYKSLKQRKLVLVLSLFLMAFALTFILITRWERLTNLEDPQNSVTQRLNYWRTAIAIIKAHPVLGVGPGNLKDVFLKYKVGLSTNTRYAHNIFLHMWAETGILGLIGIVYLIINFLKKFGTQRGHRLIFLAGIAFIAHNLIDNTYFIPETGIFLWILLAL